MERHGLARTDTDEHGQGQTRDRGAGRARRDDDPLIPKHGGYRHLKTFQIAGLIYDVTARFCEKYLAQGDRTRDQMRQAARSGRQNIAEGSVDSATSKKIEMKLTGVAIGSLEELRLDYEDFLRQRGLPQWKAAHPALMRFKARRCASVIEFRRWVAEEMRITDEHGLTQTNSDANRHAKALHGASAGPGACASVACPSVSVRACPCQPAPACLFVANGVLSLLNLCIHWLNRQLHAQAGAFERDGGFTERLYRHRTQRRER